MSSLTYMHKRAKIEDELKGFVLSKTNKRHISNIFMSEAQQAVINFLLHKICVLENEIDQIKSV